MRDIEHLPSTAVLALVFIWIAIFNAAWWGVVLTPAWIGLFGAQIGGDPEVACNATGGKWGSAANRCVTRACYAAHDCGHWTHPNVWRNRVKLGDDIATVVFWFGEPDKPVSKQDWTGETTYIWWVGICCVQLPRFSATFKDGRLVRLSPVITPPAPYDFESASL
jgi:hypothetical protein